MRQTSPLEHLFHAQLGLTIAVGRLRAVGFQNRHALRLSVGCSGGGEHDLVDAVRNHGFQQNLGAAQVVVIIFERIGHGFADQRVCGKVNHTVDLLGFKDGVHECAVTDIALIKFCLWMNRFNMSGFQIVRDNNLSARVNEFIYGMRADITSTA